MCTGHNLADSGEPAGLEWNLPKGGDCQKKLEKPAKDYTQYGPIKNSRIKNQHSDFEKNKEPVVRILGLKNRFTC